MTTNYERAFEARPDVYAAWRQLVTAVKANMDERRFELATLAAAQRLKSSYCSLAHATVLQDKLGEDVLAILRGRAETLSEVDVAVIELAEEVVDDATATDAGRARLRELGLTDEEIMDVVLAASARCFFSKTLDGLAVLPDASYAGLDDELREALVVGRPIAAAVEG
jgi:alkylhydroperoxidase family enzyme